jgi:hypothetical protein
MKRLAKITVSIQVILFASVILISACNPTSKIDKEGELTPDEAKSIAKEAFL